jgi:hypothetical protein
VKAPRLSNSRLRRASLKSPEAVRKVDKRSSQVAQRYAKAQNMRFGETVAVDRAKFEITQVL